MVNFCCVAECKNEYYPGCGFSFHRFPRDESMREKWTKVVPGKIVKTSLVCSKKFEVQDYDSTSRKILKSHARPFFQRIMDKSRSAFTSTTFQTENEKTPKEKTSNKKAKGDCNPSVDTSHTQFFKKDRYEEVYHRITTDEFFGHSESISGSSDTFHCIHGPEGKQYTEKGLLKRNLLKTLDPIRIDKKWDESCPPAFGWEMAKKLSFLVNDPIGSQQTDRLEAHLLDFAKTSENGIKIDVLDSVCEVIDFLVETLHKTPSLRRPLELLLKNMSKPILLNLNSDVITYFESLKSYLGYLGYLLMRMDSDDLFDLVSEAVIWQLSAPDSLRGHGAAQMRHTLAAAAPVLYEATVRMMSVAKTHRFPTLLEIALFLACDSVETSMAMMNENIIENVFYRFNPYFPVRELPSYDINPADLQDHNLKLGDSSLNMSTTLSLLLVLLKTTKQCLDENPKLRRYLPCPDDYAQRCFVWAYRYECRAREHRHQRSTLTVIVSAMLHIFGERLKSFSSLLMADIISLSVLTELPPRSDWTSTVSFNTLQQDVQFKKMLIYLCVDFLKIFPYNKFMVESRHWMLGLMYLLDPGLCSLRARWSPALFSELRKTALQALVCTMCVMASNIGNDYGMIRRLMWYIEWYSESAYELSVLYWCMRLLQISLYNRKSPSRKVAIKNLFDSHGIIILMYLCQTLLKQKIPPLEKAQAILAITLRLLTSAVEANEKIACCVYPGLTWPASINSTVKKMMDIIMCSLDKNSIVSDRWLISLLNFIWQAIIWKKENRAKFVANNGIYKLLDIITMTHPPVQCIALALVCDAARAGDAVGQLVSWRANAGASYANPMLVKRGSTIVSLLAAVFKNDCLLSGVQLDDQGIIMNLDCPLMSKDIQNQLKDPNIKEGHNQKHSTCLAAADLAGSRMSKAFALLHMLCEDLSYSVSLADETYNLFKNIKLPAEEEALIVLCSHYLTIKFNETWMEAQAESPGLAPEDETVLDEFLHIGKGWAKEIKLQQQDVLRSDRKKELQEENSLYAFLGRVRLNIALDGLREVRCVARSADRARISHALLQDAVRAHHRRSVLMKQLEAPILRTYGPPLDDQVNAQLSAANDPKEANEMNFLYTSHTCQKQLRTTCLTIS